MPSVISVAAGPGLPCWCGLTAAACGREPVVHAPKGRRRTPARSIRRRAHRDGGRARSWSPRIIACSRHPLCRTTGGASAVATTAPAARWSGMLDATNAGPHCMQDTGRDPQVGKPTSENCLTLNVWTPAARKRIEKRPVMVWIHGGGFVNGSGDIYYARWLAARGHIVVVTINYRLGALGFPGPPVARPARHVGQLRPGRPAGRAAMGPRQHRRVRRRSAAR